MIEYKYREELGEEDYKFIGIGFEDYSKEQGVSCDYKPFSFSAYDDGKLIGIITGNSYYKEVHVGDLIVSKEYRHNKIGKTLLEKVEEYFNNKGFENINLSTFAFQAPEFYKKCGYEVEYIRENKNDPRLNKIFLIKHI